MTAYGVLFGFFRVFFLAPRRRGFLDIRIASQIVCPDCGEEVDMEIGPDEEMPVVKEEAKLIEMIRGEEEVAKMDALLSLALTGGDYDWI